MSNQLKIDATDRLIIKATQGGLPLASRPYHALADELSLDPIDVMARLQSMLDNGVIRRIGAVPNHYKLGYGANGMTVWDVRDEDITDAGRAVGALDFVSHCYHRPRHLPDWPYSLFAMVHGRDKGDVEREVDIIKELLGDRARSHEILYSTRILKKTGLRLVA
jgi:DNA-binding Lrp family transcriptional regulator